MESTVQPGSEVLSFAEWQINSDIKGAPANGSTKSPVDGHGLATVSSLCVSLMRILQLRQRRFYSNVLSPKPKAASKAGPIHS